MVPLGRIRAGAGDAPQGGEVEDGDRRGRLSLKVLEIGARARAALERSGGRASPLAAFPDSPYYAAGGDIVWVGAQLPAMHPRAVRTEIAPSGGMALRFGALPRHRPSARLPLLRDTRLLASIAPRGYAFPGQLALAYRRGDPDAVYEASIAMLGLGHGFTPSGDDLAGGALFGRRLRRGQDARWRAMSRRLCAAAAHRTHPVSAALFSDLARGRSFAPLHALAVALAAEDEPGALAAARELARIGHSSGREMLAGVALGAGVRL